MVEGEKEAIVGAISQIEGRDFPVDGLVIMACCVAQEAAYGVGSILRRLRPGRHGGGGRLAWIRGKTIHCLG